MTAPNSLDELIANYRSAKANGDPAKYVHVISVEQAHRTADTLTILRDALGDARGAVQAFTDMVSVMQRWQAIPIPAILETAQHNCTIILEKIDAALTTAKIESNHDPIPN